MSETILFLTCEFQMLLDQIRTHLFPAGLAELRSNSSPTAWQWRKEAQFRATNFVFMGMGYDHVFHLGGIESKLSSGRRRLHPPHRKRSACHKG
jgi:hypothetical protein